MPPSGTGRSPNAHLSHNDHDLAGWGEAPLDVGLAVYEDEDYFDVRAEIVITTPGSEDSAEVRVSDDGCLTWTRDYWGQTAAIVFEPEFCGWITNPGHAGRGDTYAAGAWLRRLVRDPSVNPWPLLDQLTTPATSLSGPRSRPSGGSGTRVVSAGSTGRGRAG